MTDELKSIQDMIINQVEKYVYLTSQDYKTENDSVHNITKEIILERIRILKQTQKELEKRINLEPTDYGMKRLNRFHGNYVNVPYHAYKNNKNFEPSQQENKGGDLEIDGECVHPSGCYEPQCRYANINWRLCREHLKEFLNKDK